MATATETSLQAPFIALKHDEEKGIKDVSSVPCADEEENRLQVAGTLSFWCGILCFLAHVASGVVVTTISYIPYIGESPSWLRAAILIANLTAAGLDHLGTCMSTSAHTKLDNLWKAMLVPALLGLFFFLSKLCTVLPLEESTSVVLAFLVLLVSPGVVYTKTTGKAAPNTHSEIMDSFSTRAGVALHTGADVAVAVYFVFCWKLMGSPLLMGWLR